MPSFWDRINPIGNKSFVNPIANKSYRKAASNFLTGTPEKRENVSTLRPEQEPNYQNLQNSIQQKGAGGAFGDVADYYRNNLSDNPADFNSFAAPQLRQYNEDIVPGLSEQFAGMGSGGLSSSGFRNAQVQGATDLSERLGAIRANLRQSSAQGLQNLGQLGLGNFSQNMVTQQGTQGVLPGVLGAVGTAVGGPVLGAVGSAAGNWASNQFGGNKVGANSSPYGGAPVASAQIQPRQQLPNFMGR